jgi:hypothetical protein
MKMARCCAAFALLLSHAARADLTLTANVEGALLKGPMTVKIKGDKVRVDNSSQVSTIINATTGEIITLINNQKKFTRISAERARAMIQTAARFGGGTPPPDGKARLTATGRKEMIDGYETQEYVRDTPQLKETFWVSTTYPNAAAIAKQLASTTPQMWGSAAAGGPDYRDLPGVPLKTQVKINTMETTTTITSIKEDPLPDTLFQPPADYRELKLPDLGAVPPAKKLMQPNAATPPAQPTPPPTAHP